MTVVMGDVTQPAGELEAALFPVANPADLFTAYTTRIEGYIADGVARVATYGIVDDVDAATTAWVYYRAYHAVGVRLLAQARTASIEGQATTRHEQEQADGFFALANSWRAIFDDLIPAANAADPTEVPSASMVSVFRW